MYESLTITLMNLSWIKGTLIAVGVISSIGAFIAFLWLCYLCDRGSGSVSQRAVLAISFSLGILMLASSIVVYNNKWLDPNWRIALEVSKRIDKYVDANPGSIYDPDRLLEEVDKSILSIFEAVHRVPGLITKLTNGQTMDAIKDEIDTQRSKEQFEAFKAWQKQNK